MGDNEKQPIIRLYAPVAKAMGARFRNVIKDHNLTFAVNQALADHLRSLGVNIPVLADSREQQSKARTKYWKNARKAGQMADETVEAEREKRRERNRKRKAAQTAEAADSEQGIEGDLKIEFV